MDNEKFENDVELKNAYSELQQIFNSSGDGMCLINKDYEIVKISDKLLYLMNSERDRILFKKCYDVFYNKKCKTENCPVLKVLKDKKTYANEIKFNCKNRKIDYLVTSAPLFDTKGEVKGVIQSFKDITDIKKKEYEAKKYLNLLKYTVDSVPDIIAVIKPDLTVELINEAGCKFLNLPLESMKGRNWYDILCGRTKYVEYLVKQVIETQKPLHKELYFDDIDMYFDIFCNTVFNENGELLFVVERFKDITIEKKNIEELRRAKEQAEEASRLKTQFLANMSHEIRTPLNGIVGIIELLEDTNLTYEQKEYIEMLQYSSGRLSSIVNNILDISKIEAGAMSLKMREFSVKTLLQDLITHFKFQAVQKGLEFHHHIDNKIPDILPGDSDKLNQILFNLLGNAIKFTEEGFINLNVNLLNEDEENYTIEFIVSDTGIGIPEGKEDYIFENFSQLDSSSNKKYKGTGLGLSISKKLIELMDGEIIVRSQYGEGSTFIFTIPFARDINKSDAGDNYLKEYDEAILKPLSGLRILVVEDDIVNQKIISNLLKKGGCEVILVESGKDALEHIHKQSFNIILMDVHMPVMDGYEATRIIRRIEAENGSYTPIIALTASATTDTMEKCKKSGMDSYITKPVKKDELYNSILRVYKLQKNKVSLDLSPLLERLEGNTELLNELIDEITCQQYENEFISSIEKYIQNGDFENLKKQVHKFKGSISNFELQSLNKLLEQMRDNIKNHNLSEVRNIFEKIKVEYKWLKQQLKIHQQIMNVNKRT